MIRNPFDILRQVYEADPNGDPAQLARRVIPQLTDEQIEDLAKGALLHDDDPLDEDDYYDLALEELVTGVYDLRAPWGIWREQ